MSDEANPFDALRDGSDLAGGEPRVHATGVPSYALAGWWSRVGAVLLDGLAMLVPIVVLVIVLHQYHVTHFITIYGTVGTTTTTSKGAWLDGVVGLIYPIALLTRVGARNGQTLGKQAARIRVVRNDGNPVDLRTVIIREGIGKAIVPGLLFGASTSLRALAVLAGLYLVVDYLWPLWERENRALHDLLAGTHVVRLDDRQGARFSPALT
jgi:uncharacterized RDD family membrane protein YckC